MLYLTQIRATIFCDIYTRKRFFKHWNLVFSNRNKNNAFSTTAALVYDNNLLRKTLTFWVYKTCRKNVAYYTMEIASRHYQGLLKAKAMRGWFLYMRGVNELVAASLRIKKDKKFEMCTSIFRFWRDLHQQNSLALKFHSQLDSKLSTQVFSYWNNLTHRRQLSEKTCKTLSNSCKTFLQNQKLTRIIREWKNLLYYNRKRATNRQKCKIYVYSKFWCVWKRNRLHLLWLHKAQSLAMNMRRENCMNKAWKNWRSKRLWKEIAESRFCLPRRVYSRRLLLLGMSCFKTLSEMKHHRVHLESKLKEVRGEVINNIVKLALVRKWEKDFQRLRIAGSKNMPLVKESILLRVVRCWLKLRESVIRSKLDPVSETTAVASTSLDVLPLQPRSKTLSTGAIRKRPSLRPALFLHNNREEMVVDYHLETGLKHDIGHGGIGNRIDFRTFSDSSSRMKLLQNRSHQRHCLITNEWSLPDPTHNRTASNYLIFPKSASSESTSFNTLDRSAEIARIEAKLSQYSKGKQMYERDCKLMLVLNQKISSCGLASVERDLFKEQERMLATRVANWEDGAVKRDEQIVELRARIHQLLLESICT